MSFLFVYGTLMRKCKPNDWSAFLQENANYIGEATTHGKLYKIDFYPGLVKGEGTVYGEVYKLHQPELTLPTLDEYEDFIAHDLNNSLYLREKASVRLTKNQKVMECWIYYFNRSVYPYTEIRLGKFTD